MRNTLNKQQKKYLILWRDYFDENPDKRIIILDDITSKGKYIKMYLNDILNVGEFRQQDKRWLNGLEKFYYLIEDKK